MDYVKNAWYVAGWASEFSRELTRVTIVETDIVMYRTQAGHVVALLDRCPHKFLPLSMGKLVGDDVQCGYHGSTYDKTGVCVRVPGQERIPKAACVRAFPVIERHDIVWIWLGERHAADESQLFDLAQFTDPAWEAHQGDALHIGSSYLNLAENLVDPAHVSFVHPTTLGNPQSEDVPVQFDTSGDVITAWRWIRNAPPVGFFQRFGGFSGNVDRWHYYYLHLPSVAVIDFGSADTQKALPEDRREEGVRVFAVHLLTPVSAEHTIDRWMHLRNVQTGDDAVAEQMDELFRITFDEDKAILEAMALEERKAKDQSQVLFTIDKGAVAYRKRIADLIAAETR